MSLTDYGDCRKCGLPRTWYGGQANCAPCLRARRKARYADDPEYRERKLVRNTAKRYGITDDLVRELLARAACDACESQEPGSPKGWHIDHDHESGMVRGLLCHSCNTALGLLNEDPERMSALITYIKRF